MLFTESISQINSTQVDNAKDLDVVMSMHNLAEYSDNYAQTSGNFWQYHKNDPNNKKIKLLVIQVQGKSNRENA